MYTMTRIKHFSFLTLSTWSNELFFSLWLAPWRGKLCCDYLSEQVPVQDYPLCSARKYCSFPIIYWPSLFGKDGWILAFFFCCMLMTSNSVAVHQHTKKNLANIQPSWYHASSITHTYMYEQICQGGVLAICKLLVNYCLKNNSNISEYKILLISSSIK